MADTPKKVESMKDLKNPVVGRPTNEMRQSVPPGLITRVEAGFALVIERPFSSGIDVFIGPCTVRASLRRDIAEGKMGLGKIIANRQTLIPLETRPIKVDYDSTIGDKDDIQVGVPAFVNFKVRNDETSIREFYSHRSAVEVLETKISNIISKVVAISSYKDLKNMKINFQDFSKSIGKAASLSSIEQDVKDLIPELKVFGIEVEDVIIRDVDLPKNIEDAITDKEANDIRIEKDKATAAANIELKQKELEAKKLQAQMLRTEVASYLDAGLSREQVAEIYKRKAMPDNATFIDTGSASVTPTIMTPLSDTGLRRPGSRS